MTKKSVLGVDITIDSREDILEHIKKYLDKIKDQRSKIKDNKIKPFVIFTPNPEIITYAQKEDKFRQIVNSNQINIPDGMGVIWALKKLYGINVKRLSGADLMLDLCKLASERSLTIGLIGGRDKVALEVKECLLNKYPNLKIEVLEAPELEISKIKDQISKIHIKDQKIDILFVALGFPKQEYFIRNIKDQISLRLRSGQAKIKSERPLVLMAVGGTFNYLAGKAARAPKWMRDIGLEWLYRLFKEPWRLSRQIAGAKFFYDILFHT